MAPPNWANERDYGIWTKKVPKGALRLISREEFSLRGDLQGLNRLRKNPERMEKIPKRVPQGLKCLRENYTRYL